MTFAADLRGLLEAEEQKTVGNSFGTAGAGVGSFSITRMRNWIVANYGSALYLDSPATQVLTTLADRVPSLLFQSIVASAIRYAFLIELTDLKVGSTKMKTRWLLGYIQMPQPGSFAPVQGEFRPGNDPRAASFDDCLLIFQRIIELTSERVAGSPDGVSFLAGLQEYTRVPYEFPVGYADPSLEPVHTAANLIWLENTDTPWLIKARYLLWQYAGEYSPALKGIERTKLEVKVYKTDRALTGKDKTNRAKRWEVLYGDFQYASLQNCWSVERKLTEELIFFDNFPAELRQRFVEEGLLQNRNAPTRCPITLAALDFVPFAVATMTATHGRSDYQIGHLTPLKRGGRHIGTNIAWQSADGNRIQGDLTLEETLTLLEGIAGRRAAHVPNPAVDADAPR